MKRILLFAIFLSLIFCYSCTSKKNYPDISGLWYGSIHWTSGDCPTEVGIVNKDFTLTITQNEDILSAIDDEQISFTGSIDDDGNFSLDASWSDDHSNISVSINGKLTSENINGTGSMHVVTPGEGECTMNGEITAHK